MAAGHDGVDDLKKKLGHVDADGGKSFGTISSYFVKKYGFDPKAQIIAFTGDNPSTMLALPLHSSDAIVSLGTSTTFLMATHEYKPDPSVHFMNHPTTQGVYMFMLCYKNGGLAREHTRDAINEAAKAPAKSWDTFNKIALETPVLGQADAEKDHMRLGLYFPRPEIVPNVKAGTWRFLYKPQTSYLQAVEEKALGGRDSKMWPHPDADARAIIESQFLSLRYRSAALVDSQISPATKKKLPPQPRRVYLVGGGAVNPAIAELAGQVLGGAEGVFKLDIGGNACALGAAYKAAWGVVRKDGEAFEDFLEQRWDESGFVKKICDGYREGVWERYGEALKGFEDAEKKVIQVASVGSK